MAEIVVGIGASHSTLMNTHWEETTHQAEATRFRDALFEARDLIEAKQPDAVLILGSNHFRGFWLDLIPPFTIGVGEVNSSGESGTPKGPQLSCPELGQHLVESLVESGRFDPAFSARIQIDHGQSHAIQYVLRDIEVPVVPLVVNVFAPPLPTVARCQETAEALRAAIESFELPGLDRPTRVAIIASGGLSHRLPWPDWREPKGEDEAFMVEAWLDGRENWSSYDKRRREIIRAAEASITPEFDGWFLELLMRGAGREMDDWTSERIDKEAGNGAQEIRSWLMMATLMGNIPARRLSYEPIPEWLTGMGVVVLDPSARALAHPFRTRGAS